MTDIVERLRNCENDPMWADHAEIAKCWCKEAADEIKRLRAWQDQHDCCMCGSRMSDHDIGSGHSPVSMYDYYQLQLEKRAEAAEARIAALEASGQTRAEIIEECAKVAEWSHMVPPDGGSPTEEERAVAEAAARNIRALAAQEKEKTQT
jgi:hypothetical protein